MEPFDNPSPVHLGSHGRFELTKVDADNDGPLVRLVVLYCNRGIELAHPRHMLNALSSWFDMELPQVQFSWCLRPNVRSFFYKTGSLFRSSAVSIAHIADKCSSGTCACSSLPAHYRDHPSGHLHTSDTSWISQHLGLPHIADLLMQGLNHVPLAPICPDDIMDLNCWVAEQVVTTLL